MVWLGHVAVKLAIAMGADVTVFTTSKNKVKDALRLGAKRAIVVSNKKAMAAAIRSFDLIVDTASAVHDIDLFLRASKAQWKEGTCSPAQQAAFGCSVLSCLRPPRPGRIRAGRHTRHAEDA